MDQTEEDKIRCANCNRDLSCGVNDVKDKVSKIEVTTKNRSSSSINSTRDTTTTIVSVYDALSTVFNYKVFDQCDDQHRHHHGTDNVDVYVCASCSIILNDLYKTYKELDFYRQAGSYLTEKLQRLENHIINNFKPTYWESQNDHNYHQHNMVTDEKNFRQEGDNEENVDELQGKDGDSDEQDIFMTEMKVDLETDVEENSDEEEYDHLESTNQHLTLNNTSSSSTLPTVGKKFILVKRHSGAISQNQYQLETSRPLCQPSRCNDSLMQNQREKARRVQRWTLKDLRSAMEAVESKSMSFRTASRTFGIPCSTLCLKTKGWKGRKKTGMVYGHDGAQQSISREKEEELALSLKIRSKWGWGLSKTMILNIVQEYVVKNNIPNRFKDNRPGKQWFRDFCSRNKLPIKKTGLFQTSGVRLSNDPSVIYEFYKLLSDLIMELGLADRPDLIFNLNESGFKSDAAALSTKSAGKRESNENFSTTTTVLTCVNAAGNKLPPTIIHKGKRLWDSMKGSKAYSKTSYFVTEEGSLTSDTFRTWFHNQFLPSMNTRDRPILLIYDGPLAHLEIELIEEALKEQVTILKLPSHTSHMLSRSNLSVLQGLKIRWDDFLAEWVSLNTGKSLTKAEFANLIGKLWTSLEPEAISKGFKGSGLFDPALSFPVNFSAIPKSHFDPEKWKRFENVRSMNLLQPLMVHYLPATST